MKRILNEFWKFLKKLPIRIINPISHPQYLLFLLELSVLSLINTKNPELDWVMKICIGILYFVELYRQRDISYGSVSEQLNGNEQRGRRVIVSPLKPRIKPRIFFLFIIFIVTLIYIILFSITQNNKFVHTLVIPLLLLQLIYQLIYNLYNISPFLVIFTYLIFLTIVSAIGIDKGIINWTLLLLFFGTTIGGNFFDKNLVKDRFLEDITEENLILRKISFYIGLVFLYISVFISDKVINSTFYYLGLTSEFSSINIFL